MPDRPSRVTEVQPVDPQRRGQVGCLGRMAMAQRPIECDLEIVRQRRVPRDRVGAPALDESPGKPMEVRSVTPANLSFILGLSESAPRVLAERLE